MSDLSVRSSTVSQGTIGDISSQPTSKSGSSGKLDTLQSTLKDQLGTDKLKLVDKSKSDSSTEPTAKRTFGFAEKFPKLAFATGLLLSCVPLLNLAVVLSPETFFGGDTPPEPGTDQFQDSTQVPQGHYSDQTDKTGGQQKTQALARTGSDMRVGTSPLEKRQLELANTALEELRGPFKALYTSDKHLDAMCEKLLGQSLADSFSQDDINELKKTIGEAIQDNQPPLSRQQIQDFVAETLQGRHEQQARLQTQEPTTKPSSDVFTTDELTSIFCSDDTLNEICKQVTGGMSFKDSLPPDQVTSFKSGLEQKLRSMDGPLDLDKANALVRNYLSDALGIHEDYRKPVDDPTLMDDLIKLATQPDTLDEICKQVTSGISFKDSLPPDQVASFKSELEQAIRTMDGPLDLDKVNILIQNRLSDALGISEDYRK